MKTQRSIAGWTVAAATAWTLAGADPATAQPPAPPAAPALEDPFLLREPQTADEFFRGAVQAQRLGRPNLARQYLQGFLDAGPTDDDLLALRDAYGPGPFAALAAAPELRPLSADLARRVNDVFRRRGASPDRLDALIDDYLAGGPQAGPARVALVGAGTVAVPQVLARLRTEPDDYRAGRLLDLLAAVGEPAVPALHAALDARDVGFRTQVASVLGRIGSRRSVPHLFYPAYAPDEPIASRQAAQAALAEALRLSRAPTAEASPADVARRLSEEAVRSWTDPAPPVDPLEDPAAGTRTWSWDEAAGTVSAADLEPRTARLLRGSRFAGEAFGLAPERRDLQALLLAFRLALETRTNGRPVPAPGQGPVFHAALAAGPELVSDALRTALRLDMPGAALPALAILGQTLNPSAAFGTGGPLEAALESTDPRVRLAAAVATLEVSPDKPFPGSRRVVEILARSLSESDVPTALVIDQNPQRAATMAGFVREFGYDAVVSPTGQAGFVEASERMQPAFVLVNLNVVRWPLSQTLANLRADARTRGLPVLVYGPQAGSFTPAPAVRATTLTLYSGTDPRDPLALARRDAVDDARTIFLTETVTSPAFANQMRPVLAAMAGEPLSAEERSEARATAAYWLARIADSRLSTVFDLAPAEPALLSAVSDPPLAINAMLALSFRPTAAAQQGIAGAVLAGTTEESARRLAGTTLIDHVRRYGALLDEATVADLYRLQAATPDADLRMILAAFDGALRPGAKRIESLLRGLPVPGAGPPNK